MFCSCRISTDKRVLHPSAIAELLVCELLSGEQLKWTPLRLWLYSDRRRLYVAVNKWEGGYTDWQVVVFGIVYVLCSGKETLFCFAEYLRHFKTDPN